MEALKIFYLSSWKSCLISMLLSADGFFFSSKSCILISLDFLSLPSILSLILIVRYWRGSIQYTQNCQGWNFAFHTFLQMVPTAKPLGAVGISQLAICTNYTVVNFSLLNPFLILCDSFSCRTVSHFSSLFLRWHAGLFLFQRGGGGNPFNLQMLYLCLSSSYSLLLYNFKWLLESLLLWLLISPRGHSWAVPWSFLSCYWSGTACPRQNCSLVLHLIERGILPSPWCKTPKLGAGVIY